MRLRRGTLLFLLLTTVSSGCSKPQTITLDFSSAPVRLLINHQGWPRPFSCPRVTQFAMASNEDGAVWELESDDPGGVAARQLAMIYGEIPPGFHQITPVGSARAPALISGRTYFAAAAGPRSVYRIVFALPLDTLEAIRGGAIPSGRQSSRPSQ